MLRESATRAVHRVRQDRWSGLREKRAGPGRMLDDATDGDFAVARIEHYLSVPGVTVEALRDHGASSPADESPGSRTDR
ncbi:hypothetical protein [Rhodococcus jostii]|uniref:hypothetical protein n=1 Tax=Rhodococcus jostii TaxID=132919 RepID=UPI003624C167